VPNEIKPALTAEEWATVRDGGEWKAKVGQPLEVSLYGGGGVDFLALPDAHLLGPDRHALAALALYWQEFGFTWDDIVDLSHAANLIESEWGVGEGGTESKLREIAARIAALLPPEE
jgi:hypothetical protein